MLTVCLSVGHSKALQKQLKRSKCHLVCGLITRVHAPKEPCIRQGAADLSTWDRVSWRKRSFRMDSPSTRATSGGAMRPVKILWPLVSNFTKFRNALIFGDARISLQHGVQEASMPKQLDLSSRFDTIPACDRQTDGHRTTSTYCAVQMASVLWTTVRSDVLMQ